MAILQNHSGCSRDLFSGFFLYFPGLFYLGIAVLFLAHLILIEKQ